MAAILWKFDVGQTLVAKYMTRRRSLRRKAARPFFAIMPTASPRPDS